MERIDPQMAARVWQRVQAAGKKAEKQPPAEVPSHEELIARLWVDGRLCQRLASSSGGRCRTALLQIAREKQACVNRLKGICRLQTGTSPAVHTPPVPTGTAAHRLSVCCDGTALSASILDKLGADPQYGQEYVHMASLCRQHHRQLLTLLGDRK